MLLEFNTKNYKSFVDEIRFSMIPSTRQTGLDYSIFSEKIGNKNYKGLCSSVVYGPNAAGKTNIIGAMDTMKSIVKRGTIQNSEKKHSANIAASALELIPNCENSEPLPTEFQIKFIENNLLIEYCICAKLGKFMDFNAKREITKECLSVNGKRVFVREKDLELNFTKDIIPFLNSSNLTVNDRKILDIARNSLASTELFLNNGFKNIFAKNLANLILNWFNDKLIIVYSSYAVQSTLSGLDGDGIYVEKTITEAAKLFGINSNDLGYKSTNQGNDIVLCSIFKNKKIAIPSMFFESYGTIRFVNEFPFILSSLAKGATLVMDEFDASIHPMALMNIINIYHNDNINKKHAQLIFNTHNPIFLNASLFRRDEIKFVERNKANNSILYSLSDFKTKQGIRKGEDYMKNYFITRYGAIKEIDFVPLFDEKLISTLENH